MLEINIEQIIADVLAKYPVHESVKNDQIGKMKIDCEILAVDCTKKENIDTLILEYENYKVVSQKSIITIKHNPNSPQWAKNPKLFEAESWVAYHTAVIEYLQKQKHAPGAPEFNDDFKNLFVDDNSMFLAIELAKKYLTDDSLRWKFGERGAKHKIVTFWKVISNPKYKLTRITPNDFDNGMLLPCQAIANQFQVPNGIGETTVYDHRNDKPNEDFGKMTKYLASILKPEK